MPNATVLQVQAGNLPQGYCPASLQDLLNNFSKVQTVTFQQSGGSTNGFLQVGTAKPSDTSNPWQQLDSLGRPVRIYVFAQGAWLSLHPLVPGFTMIWTGALPDFTIFDGGDSNALSAISGPMWEVVSSLQDNFPVGAGGAYGVGATGGEAAHTLTSAELPALKLRLPFKGTDGFLGSTDALGDPMTGYGINDDPTPKSRQLLTTEALGGGGSHNNLPPYLGVYFVRRTSRLFFAVT